jgi:predicted CoA-binding protein
VSDADPLQLLRETRTIAMVGASPNPAKPSHGVMRYLLHAGYRVVPVRGDGCEEVLGVPCVSSLTQIDEPIDMVDVFRRPEFCAEHAREAVEAGAKSLWLQLGIRSPEARRIAQEAGLAYVENACTAALHQRHIAHDG